MGQYLKEKQDVIGLDEVPAVEGGKMFKWRTVGKYYQFGQKTGKIALIGGIKNLQELCY
jgi:hypothetical protein